MKRLLALTGIGTTIAAAAVAGGVGVALAHGGPDDHGDGQHMMGGAAMQMNMDPAAMQQHMKDILGRDTYEQMQGAMKQILGEDGYQQMLERMQSACSTEGMGGTMPGANGQPPDAGHNSHHATSAVE